METASRHGGHADHVSFDYHKAGQFHDQMTVEAFDDLMQALVEAGFEAINTEQLVDSSSIMPKFRRGRCC
jgi:transcriptional/translational regulatory protein YebC/TACO1